MHLYSSSSSEQSILTIICNGEVRGNVTAAPASGQFLPDAYLCTGSLNTFKSRHHPCLCLHYDMRAFVINELAHPSKITLSNDAPEPVTGKGQVLIDVYSAGLNFFDVSIIALEPA